MDLILRIAHSVSSRWRQFVLRLRGAQLHGACWLRDIEVPRNAWDIELGADVALDRSVTIISTGVRERERRIVIGARCYINRFTIVDASERIEIGADVLIGPHCYITDHDHAPGGGVVSAPVKIADHAWLGAHVTVLKGVTIGERAVVGAGSVVTRDVPAGATVVGNPARPKPSGA